MSTVVLRKQTIKGMVIGIGSQVEWENGSVCNPALTILFETESDKIEHRLSRQRRELKN